MILQFPRFLYPRRKTPVRVIVDLTRLSGDGTNGGVKPALFRQLGTIAQEQSADFIFIYLVRASMIYEVEIFRRSKDLNVCIEPIPSFLERYTRRKDSNLKSFENLGSDPIGALYGDILYAPTGFSNYVTSGLPYIALIADTLHRDMPEMLPQEEVAFRETWHQDVLQRADAIQCVSQFGANQLKAHFNIPAEKIFVIYHGLNQLNPAQTIYRSSRQKPYFFYPANDWPHKNHLGLLKAYAEYRNRVGDTAWDLILSGHQSQSVPWTTWLSFEELGGQCRHMGFLTSDKLRETFGNAGALVFPSLYEGFGLPILEAFHYNIPIASSNRASLREICGPAAILFDPYEQTSIADSLIRVSTESTLRQELIDNGASRRQLFNLSQQSAALAELFSKLAKRRPP
jgi:glycosyltransferase involved in cell wall biosynthesis